MSILSKRNILLTFALVLSAISCDRRTPPDQLLTPDVVNAMRSLKSLLLKSSVDTLRVKNYLYNAFLEQKRLYAVQKIDSSIGINSIEFLDYYNNMRKDVGLLHDSDSVYLNSRPLCLSSLSGLADSLTNSNELKMFSDSEREEFRKAIITLKENKIWACQKVEGTADVFTFRHSYLPEFISYRADYYLFLDSDYEKRVVFAYNDRDSTRLVKLRGVTVQMEY